MSRSRRAATPLGRLVIAAAIAGLAGGVSACEAGYDAPTLEYHPQSPGLDTVVHGIKVIDAFVLGAPAGSSLPAGQSAGLFLTLYNTNGGTDKLAGASAPGIAKSVMLPGGAVTLRSQQAVYLTGPRPAVVLTGLLRSLASGGSIHVILDFMNAGSVTLNLPVLPRAFDYGTFSPAPTPSPSPAKRGATGKASSAPANAPPATVSATPSPSS